MTIQKQPELHDIDQRITQTALEIFERAGKDAPSIFDKAFWQGKLMEWVMEDESFKIDLFRLIDVMPTLKESHQTSRHIKEYLIKKKRKMPAVMNLALKIASSGIGSALAANSLKSNIVSMAKTFIAGESLSQAEKEIHHLSEMGYYFTFDLLGEAVVSDVEAELYQKAYFDLIDDVDNMLEEKDQNSTIPVKNVSLKTTAFDARIDPADPLGSIARLKNKILPILLHAKKKDVFVNFDLEQWKYHSIVYYLFEELVCHPELKDWPKLGIVVQAYLKSSQADLKYLLDLVKIRNCPLTVRLVKGAYWDYEVIKARQEHHECPVFLEKNNTDANYEDLSRILLDQHEMLHPAFGSHNLRSLLQATTYAKEKGIADHAFEIQMLYGMADPLRNQFGKMGVPVRLYTPLGEFLPGIAYLVRRLLENTSNNGFLRQSFHEKKDLEQILAKPDASEIPEPQPAKTTKLPLEKRLQKPFANFPLTDFTNPVESQKLDDAIKRMPDSFPIKTPVVCGNKTRLAKQFSDRYDPGCPTRLVVSSTKANLEEAEEAVQQAFEAWPQWRDKPVIDRAMLLLKLADILKEDRYNLAALQVYEVGKTKIEADADVAEAIDFCEYYARRAMVELSSQTQGHLPGEDNQLFYEGRGPTAIIAPWNFPLAILCGMTTAALVAGNTVIIKPSGNSVGVAYRFFEYMTQAGIGSPIAQFLPGSGDSIGNHLVEHPLIAQIAFTGSEEVGLSIIEKAAKTHPKQPQVKRVVCEMGGKNAIIVDASADLDEAVPGVLSSAFGYAGQKCSACSKVVVIQEVYDEFTKRLTEAAGSLKVLPAEDAASEMGPVVDEVAYKRLTALIENPGKGAKKLFSGRIPEEGFFVPPTIFEITDPNHLFLIEELFGPVLAVIKAKDFDHALELALSSRFALTGSVYSRTPSNLALATKRFRVGNLYLNRGSTGALVERQPFGGFGRSGIGTKAGGPGYLLHFADPRCVSENRMRKGFSPDFLL